jgi:hypothetical protein
VRVDGVFFTGPNLKGVPEDLFSFNRLSILSEQAQG